MIVLAKSPIGCLIAVGLLLYCTTVQAAFKDDYIKGVEQIERSNWDRALPLLQSAAASEPQSQAKMRLYGMRFSPYVPHYYLGVAQYQLGDCDSARQSFATALRNGVITGMSEGAQLQKYDADCASRVDDSQRQQQQLAQQRATEQRQQQLAQLRSQLQGIRQQLSHAGGTSRDSLWGTQWRAGGSLQGQFEAFTASATQFETRLENDADLTQLGSEIAVLASQTGDFASSVDRQLNTLRLAEQERKAADRQQLARRSAQQQEQQRQAQAEKAELNRVISETVGRAGEMVQQWPEEIGEDRQRAALAQVVKRVFSAGDASLDDLRALDRDLKAAINNGQQRLAQWQEELASRPPEALVAAVDEYFQGNFERAIALLREAQFDSRPAQFYQNLFTAAAHFQTAEKTDDTSRQKMMQLVDQHLITAKQVDQSIPLDPNVFSPKFIAHAKTTLK